MKKDDQMSQMTMVAGGNNNIEEHDGVSVYTHAQGKVPQPDRIQVVQDSIDESNEEQSVDRSRRGKGMPIKQETYDPDFEVADEQLDDTASLATVQNARLNQNRFSKKPVNNRLGTIADNEDEKTELGDNAVHAID